MDFFDRKEHARRQTRLLLAYFAAAVAELLGGRRIEFNSSEPDEQKLRNVVEEMAIAHGVLWPVILGREAELLRAIADVLDCPIPPFVRALASP